MAHSHALDYRAFYGEPLFNTRQTSNARGIYDTAPPDYVSRLYALLRRWRQETGPLWRLEAKIDHPAFHAITQLGSLVTPLIVRELRARPDFLFLALERIESADAPPTQDLAPSQAVDAWLSWAARNNVAAD